MRVDVPGMGVVEFPDSMSEDQIAAAIQANLPQKDWEGSSNQENKRSAIAQTIGNIPGSAANFFGGLANAVLSPVQTVMGALDLGAGALRNLAPSGVRSAVDAIDPNPQSAERASQTASAAGQMYKDRYGGLDNIRNTVIQDPVGVAADLSTVLGVGGAMAPGRVGQALSTASRYTNPLSAIPPVVRGFGKAGQQVLGLTTGVGAENIAQAAKSGYTGNRAFIENLSGQRSMTEVLTEAKDALRNMREARSQAYRTDIAQTAADTTRLNFAPIDQALVNVVDSMKHGKRWKIGSDQAGKIKEIENVVREWRLDPTSHTAIGLDALKQRLDAIYPDSPKHSQVQRAVTSVRNAVKDTIVKQSPQYAKTMDDYERALTTEKEIERALSLGTKASEDAALRKLQSLSRNNVNTNYSNRLDMARTLEDAGADILPAVSGQAMNSWVSRGLAGQGASLATLGGAAFNPSLLALLPFQSPRAVGAGLYGGGRVVRGTGSGLGLLGITPSRALLGGLLAEEVEQ